MGHADDIRSEQLGAVIVECPLQDTKQLQCFFGLGRHSGEAGQVGHGAGQQVRQRGRTSRAVHLPKAVNPPKLFQDFIQHGRVVVAVLPQVQPRRVQAKRARLIEASLQIGFGNLAHARFAQGTIHGLQRLQQVLHGAHA